MFKGTDIVDGWQLRPSGDGGFGVYDDHGMVIGPFGTRDEAFAAAMTLPTARSLKFTLSNAPAVEPADDAESIAGSAK